MKYIKYIILLLILTGAAILCCVRWDAWFSNPPEAIWQQDTIPYHFYGFGEDTIPGFEQKDSYFADIQDSTELKIVLFGDVHNNVDSTQFKTIYQRHQPIDCYAQLGDFMERCYFCYYQLLVQNLIHSGFDNIPLISTPGNHEYKKGIIRRLPEFWTELYSNPLNGPERFLESTYYIDFRGLRFICIDTNGLQRISDFTITLTWLNKVMDEAKDKYIVVMMHHPVFSGAIGRQNILIYSSFYNTLKNADLVFSGHDHLYTRRLPFVGINSAQKFYLSKVNAKDERICSGRQMYELLTLKNDTLTLQTYLMDSGEIYDEIKVYKNAENQHEYIDLYQGKTEIIDLPQKYIHRNDWKVRQFSSKRQIRLDKDTIQ